MLGVEPMKHRIVALGLWALACSEGARGVPAGPGGQPEVSAGEAIRGAPASSPSPVGEAPSAMSEAPAGESDVSVEGGAGSGVPQAEALDVAPALAPGSDASEPASDGAASESAPGSEASESEGDPTAAASDMPAAEDATALDQTPVGDAPADETPIGDARADETPIGETPASDAIASLDETAAEDAPELDSDAPTVTVSFTFDDTNGEQAEAAAILEQHGLRGTFYVNSPQLHRAAAGSSGPLSIAEVLEMQARGHDIGGHTLGHLSLTDVPEVERVREIVGDRAQLMQLGIDARSFAYPYGHVEADDPALGRPVLEIARESGYTSARDTNGFVLDNCATGPESLPPTDPFDVISVRSVNEPPEGEALRVPGDSADTLLGWVDRAASCGGGWLPLVFHHLNADCAGLAQSYCFDFAELDRLAAALATGTRCSTDEDGVCYRVQVATVSDAIGVTELAPANEVGGLRNPSLERMLASGDTECIRRTGASDDAVFSRSEIANTGAFSERLELSDPVEEPAEIGVERDYGECAVFATPGHAYDFSLHYRAEPADELPTLRFVTYRLTADYEWVAWERGVAFTARAPGEWVSLGFTTEAVPSDTIAMSFGVRQESAGVINVDDFDSVPLGPVETSGD